MKPRCGGVFFFCMRGVAETATWLRVRSLITIAAP
jgi:hypothetical protein